MELVTPGWVTALRGIGVVCNIYNMAKVSDNVIEGLEEKMGWRQRRRAKKEINRYYDGRTAELKIERKDVIKMMKKGDLSWKDLVYRPESLEITVEDKDLLLREAVKGLSTIATQIEYNRKAMETADDKIKLYRNTNDAAARKYAGQFLKFKKSKEDCELKLATVEESVRILNFQKIGDENLNLSLLYKGLAEVVQKVGIIEEFKDHRVLEDSMYDLEQALETEREMYDLSARPELCGVAVDDLLKEYDFADKSQQSEMARATNKNSNLENLVSKARAVGV